MIQLFPGFLSAPQDYQGLQQALGWDIQVFDYHGLSKETLLNLGKKICDEIYSPIHAIGYSMGGRILLEALSFDPSKFQSVCFISTNPGLKTQFERDQRLITDREWAQQFQTQNWDQVMQSWNSQSVFAGATTEPLRREEEFDRQELAQMLVNWSLARQDDRRAMIGVLSVPNLWIAGARDNKFCHVLKELNTGKKTQTRVIAEAGHRVHFEQPKALAKVIREWNQPAHRKTAEL